MISSQIHRNRSMLPSTTSSVPTEFDQDQEDFTVSDDPTFDDNAYETPIPELRPMELEKQYRIDSEDDRYQFINIPARPGINTLISVDDNDSTRTVANSLPTPSGYISENITTWLPHRIAHPIFQLFRHSIPIRTMENLLMGLQISPNSLKPNPRRDAIGFIITDPEIGYSWLKTHYEFVNGKVTLSENNGRPEVVIH